MSERVTKEEVIHQHLTLWLGQKADILGQKPLAPNLDFLVAAEDILEADANHEQWLRNINADVSRYNSFEYFHCMDARKLLYDLVQKRGLRAAVEQCRTERMVARGDCLGPDYASNVEPINGPSWEQDYEHEPEPEKQAA